jgi:hypothetical protein
MSKTLPVWKEIRRFEIVQKKTLKQYNLFNYPDCYINISYDLSDTESCVNLTTRGSAIKPEKYRLDGKAI